MLSRLINIIIFFLVTNIGFAQTWANLENDIEKYYEASEYKKGYEIADKMEVLALRNKNDTNGLLVKAHFYKMIFSVYINPSDTVYLHYANKLTQELFDLSYGKHYPVIKPILVDFLNFLKTAGIDKSPGYFMYCINLSSLANIYKKERQQDSAAKMYSTVIDLYRINHDRSGDYCLTLVTYGQLLYNQKKYNESEEKFMEVISIYDSLYLNSGSFTTALLQLCTIKILKSELNEALTMLEKFRARYDSASSSKDYHDFYDELAYLNVLCGNYLNAESLYFKISTKKGLSEEDYANSQEALADLYIKMDNYTEAKFILEKVLIERKNSYGMESFQYAATLEKLGILYKKNGNYQVAESVTKEALQIRKQLPGENGSIIAASLIDLGAIYFEVGDYLKAEDLFKKSLEIRRKEFGENNKFYIESIAELALLYHKQGNYKQAESFYYQALNFYLQNKMEGTPIFATYLNNLASLYCDLKDYKKAEPLFIEVLEIRKASTGEENVGYAFTIAGLANLYAAMGENKKAENFYNQAGALLKRLYGSNNNLYLLNLSNQSLLYEDQEDYASAAKLLSEIFSGKTKELSLNFTWLSEAEKEQYWNVEQVYFSHLNFFAAKAYKNHPSVTELAYNANIVANALLLESSNYINGLIKNSKLKNISEIYENYRKTCSLRNKFVSEGSQQKEIISSLNSRADSLDLLLSRKISSYADYKRNFSVTWNDVRLNLNNDEATIEFSRYYDNKDSMYKYMALIVKPTSKYPQLVKLCNENDLKKLSPEKELNEIYDLLWKPISSRLTEIKTIYYTPAGWMNNIPLQALYQEKDGVREYLMDKYSLNQLTSTRYLALGLKKKEQETIGTNIALFGGVNYNDFPDSKPDSINSISTEAAFLYKNAVTNRDLDDSSRAGAAYLPGTKREVENIADLLKANNWDVSMAEGKSASENKIKSFEGKNNRSILHVATHGFAFSNKEDGKGENSMGIEIGNQRYKASDNPMIRSGLLFSGSNMTWQGKGDSLLKVTNEDGVLTAYELSQLDLSNTKLVVLSACETGKGAIQGSEGTFGLKRALKLAGVDNMILSLWKVPDDATMEMMTIFYTELEKTRKPVQAFELAQKAMRNKYPNEPKKWAGFVFVR